MIIKNCIFSSILANTRATSPGFLSLRTPWARQFSGWEEGDAILCTAQSLNAASLPSIQQMPVVSPQF